MSHPGPNGNNNGVLTLADWVQVGRFFTPYWIPIFNLGNSNARTARPEQLWAMDA